MRFLFLQGIIIFCQLSMSAQTALEYDFDGDGKTDRVSLIQQEDEFHMSDEYKITYFLSASGMTFTTPTLTSGGQSRTLKLQKNVVVLACQFMRAENTFKFRYDPKLKQMKLIGFDNVQYGNAANDGSGNSSYNLLTGVYEATWNYYDHKKEQLIALPKVTKKYPIKNFTLNKFSDAVVDQLYNVGFDLLPERLI